MNPMCHGASAWKSTVVVALAGVIAASGLTAAEDVSRHHSETVTISRHDYHLPLGGTVDAENTRDPIVYGAWQQGFQPMRSVRMENIGDIDVVNPWIIVNDKRDWRSTSSIVAEALRSFGDPTTMNEADKARCLWEFVRRHRFHATTGDFEVRDPVKMFNVYGYSLCGDNASILMDLWRVAGLKSRRGFPIGHCVAEVWYGGGWHLFDADLSAFYLDRDNETVVGEKSVVHDHELIKRTGADEYVGALYNYGGTHTGEFASHATRKLNLALRPGEALEWRWGHIGKHYYARKPVLYDIKAAKELSVWGAAAWATLSNGKWTYVPRMRSQTVPSGVTARNIRWSSDRMEPAACAASAAEVASLVWKIDTPYVIVGGQVTADVRCEGNSRCDWAISFDGTLWQPIAVEALDDKGGRRANLDSFFAESGIAAYSYYLRAEFRAESEATRAGLDRITIENDLQMAVLSMPALERGDNLVRYTDQTVAPHSVRIDFDYLERSVATPAPPTRPNHPLDGKEVEGTALIFRWEPANAPAGERIVDYHFQLGNEPSLRWALAPSFEGQTKGTAEFSIGRAGRLTPGKRYYWRVRAKSDQGVWSSWGQTWSFVPQGPALPTNVRFEARDPDLLTLAWDLAPEGRRPVGFRIYASDEKGFSVSDVAYEIAAGNQREEGLYPGRKSATFPPNFLLATSKNEMAIRPTHAFFRVVAIDENGNRSAASAYASAPRPFIHTDPPRIAQAGASFHYEPKTIASIGDLTYRDFGEGAHYQSAFWDAEQPRYSFEPEYPRCGNRTADWLNLDPVTGRITGKPQAADVGEWQINLKVEITGVGTHIQSFPLEVVP